MTVIVILHLDFGASMPWSRQGFGHVIHNTAVTTFGNFVIQRQFKILILRNGNNISRTCSDPTQGTILHLPSIANAILFKVAPSCC
jgi:hypothetical protein